MMNDDDEPLMITMRLMRVKSGSEWHGLFSFFAYLSLMSCHVGHRSGHVIEQFQFNQTYRFIESNT